MFRENIGLIFLTALPAVFLSYFLSVALPSLRLRWKTSQFPVINKKKGEWSDANAVKRCAHNAQAILQEGYEKVGSQLVQGLPDQIIDQQHQYNDPFQLIGSFGRRIVLPPEMGEHVKTDPRFTASEVVRQTMAGSLPGFEGLLPVMEAGAPNVFIQMIRSKLTSNLGKFTQNLAEETQEAFDERWGTSTEWHEVDLLASLRDIVTQVSTRIFLGTELCKNKEWLDNTQAYTDNVFKAVRSIRRFPAWSRPYVQWFLSDCAKIRRQVKRAEEIIEPVIAKRIEEIALAQKGLAEMPNDAISWMHEVATGKGKEYHGAHIQLSLSMASVHTTSDLFSNILLQLCRHPEWIEPLLQEAQSVRTDGAWEKTSLYRMKLADSVMKETQRIKPLGVLLSHRHVSDDVVLPDGTLIPKGAIVATNMSRMWDPEYYPNPEEWQPDRYLKLREEPGKEHSSQFVTTTMESLGFGIGSHACPGRFFASSKIKLLLNHVLHNYEFERVDTEKDATPWFVEYVTNPKAKLRVRRKKVAA
ncbi:cytochrome P450 [Aspergillus aculeatinus CBS 121060]|uniref:Cytochrome P450 n=1 Tax=Aspergillus aculeatinus CBS 121060 TaxID=1448322 RepID=A0ACD1H1S5_9EURO|nr:cytochrome P450 [Aspergillus aculeatinus CBS 121060]RAH67323.1 cytochrome P450 [Aspergillus aculeatinus CBS 121060]